MPLAKNTCQPGIFRCDEGGQEMSGAIYTATSGALAYQMRLEVLANNLSNINTIGFKEDRTIFRTYFPASHDPVTQEIETTPISGETETVPPFLTSDALVTFERTETDFSPGQLRHTGNPLDVAIEGNGFFSIQTPTGTHFTRNGNFSLNGEGVLVTQEGFPALGNGGEIVVNTDTEELRIDEEGSIWADGVQVDTLRIVEFTDPYSLEKVGNSKFAPTDPTVSGNRPEAYRISQGFIELSNVDGIRVMTEMLEVLRGYEAYQKVIQSTDEVTSQAIEQVGQLA
jgi:flagellar basal-body rod protein FlgG